jgi:hypothetical protein
MADSGRVPRFEILSFFYHMIKRYQFPQKQEKIQPDIYIYFFCFSSRISPGALPFGTVHPSQPLGCARRILPRILPSQNQGATSRWFFAKAKNLSAFNFFVFRFPSFSRVWGEFFPLPV